MASNNGTTEQQSEREKEKEKEGVEEDTSTPPPVPRKQKRINQVSIDGTLVMLKDGITRVSWISSVLCGGGIMGENVFRLVCTSCLLQQLGVQLQTAPPTDESTT